VVADERQPTSSGAEQVRSQRIANCTLKRKLTESASIYQWIENGSSMASFGVLPNLNTKRPIAVAAIDPLAEVDEIPPVVPLALLSQPQNRVSPTVTQFTLEPTLRPRSRFKLVQGKLRRISITSSVQDDFWVDRTEYIRRML
jgi:hypothetical protein